MTAATPEDWARLAQMGEATRAAHPKAAHWYLAAIATSPDRRARGLGTALLQHALPAVDASGLPTYLESSNPRNITIYERHGFEVIGRIDIDDGVYMTPMWRP
jgi:ribosomal protein S18 acetylase RimI-like enzyme